MDDYISYTMRINTPQYKSNSLFNLVIQERDSVQEMFTVKYTPSDNQAKITFSTFNGVLSVSRGMCLPDQNGDCTSDDPGDSGGGTNTGDFVEICVDSYIPIEVKCSTGQHGVNDSSCKCQTYESNGFFHDCQRAYVSGYELIQDCYWDYQGSTGGNNTGSGNNNTGGGGSGSSTGSDTSVTTTIIDVENCTGGKIPDKNDPTICVCPSGYIENNTGNCVKKPCIGDPVKNPEIVSSGRSGKRGGTFGCTRSNWKKVCEGVKGKKKHDGIDIKAEVNTPTFAMYDAIVSSIRSTFSPGEYRENSYGNYIVLKVRVNGVIMFIKYNHLNKVNVKKGDVVKAGDIIGLNGNTGNANPPKGKVTPHISTYKYLTHLGKV